MQSGFVHFLIINLYSNCWLVWLSQKIFQVVQFGESDYSLNNVLKSNYGFPCSHENFFLNVYPAAFKLTTQCRICPIRDSISGVRKCEQCQAFMLSQHLHKNTPSIRSANSGLIRRSSSLPANFHRLNDKSPTQLLLCYNNCLLSV